MQAPPEAEDLENSLEIEHIAGKVADSYAQKYMENSHHPHSIEDHPAVSQTMNQTAGSHIHYRPLAAKTEDHPYPTGATATTKFSYRLKADTMCGLPQKL